MIACFFFAQAGIAVERIRATSLWNEPFALYGPDNLIVAASDQAEHHGVCAGQRLLSARSLCPSLLTYPYDCPSYEQAMQIVWDAVAIETSYVEPLSPEIVYGDFAGQTALDSIQRLADGFKASAYMPVRVGAGRSKITAYFGAHRSPPNEVLIVQEGRETAFLESVPLAQVHAIKEKDLVRLNRLGLKSLGDVQRLPAVELQRQFRGGGWLLQRLAQGRDNDPVKPVWPRRIIGHSVAFGEEECDWKRVEHSLRKCAERIAKTLRIKQEYARVLKVACTLADGTTRQEEAQPMTPFAEPDALYATALRLMQRMEITQPLTGLRLEAGDIGVGTGLQLSLFDANDAGIGYPHERKKRLAEALAYCHSRFGVGSVVPLRLLHSARRIHRWAGPLTRRTDEEVEVETDARGVPITYYRRGQRYQVCSVQDRWRETAWFSNRPSTKTVFQVVTSPPGLYELHRSRRQWRLGGIAD